MIKPDDILDEKETFNFLKGAKRIPVKIAMEEFAKRKLEEAKAGQHETIVMGLLRELAVRTHVVFPQNPKELKWFEEGTREAYDFHIRIDSYFEEQNP